MNIDNEKVLEIAKCILQCEDLIQNEWDEVTFVFDVAEGHVANSGFLYNEDKIRPVTASIEEQPLLVRDKVVGLRELIFKDCGHKFKQLLFQMESKTNRFRIDFEFDDENRWAIKPAKIKEMRVLLKPNFE
ncbi:MAG: hypothetical protein ACI88H_003361 [Cocleimonas sp.]|jgi:hypothetical protein